MDRKHCGKRRNCSLRAISLFPSVFKSCFPGASKCVIVWEWIKRWEIFPCHGEGYPNAEKSGTTFIEITILNSISENITDDVCERNLSCF